MKCIILYNGYSDIGPYRHQICRIEEELKKKGIEVELLKNNDFSTSIKDDDIESKLDCDFCIFLDKDLYTSKMIEKAGIRMFNSADAIEVCDDKMLTYIALAGNGISIPDSTPGPLFYDIEKDVDENTLATLEKRYGYPMVVKECYGSMGKGVHRIDNRGELLSSMKNLRGKKYLVQEMIGTSIGEDLRVIVIGGEVIGGMIRRSETDFRSNVAVGGESFGIDVPKESADVAVKTASLLGLDYCGIDLLKDEKGQYIIICEANSNAFFQSFESATGINVAEKYVEHILDAISNEP